MSRPVSAGIGRPCPHCGKVLAGRRTLNQHVRTKHREPSDDEPSIASRMIDAQLDRAMGLPVEDDWLLESLP